MIDTHIATWPLSLALTRPFVTRFEDRKCMASFVLFPV